jgi:hypothetical protein
VYDESGLRRQEEDALVGAALVGRGGTRIGRVEAAFADYLLVRTAALVPVDLYVPRPDVAYDQERRVVSVPCGRREAYTRWHRPLRRAPHD